MYQVNFTAVIEAAHELISEYSRENGEDISYSDTENQMYGILEVNYGDYDKAYE